MHRKECVDIFLAPPRARGTFIPVENAPYGMRYWPVPDSYTRSVPPPGTPGSFWEDRGDRYHCGIDIYAVGGSAVLAIEDGIVLEISIFTSPEQVHYWNTTYSVLLEHPGGYIARYAELENPRVTVGMQVRGGTLLGYVGTVLDADRIDESAPLYIQRLKEKGSTSMLHLEIYAARPREQTRYRGGNWFGEGLPDHLLDPTLYLTSAGEAWNATETRKDTSREVR